MPPVPHRPFFHGQDRLSDFTKEEHGVARRGDERCHAVGLPKGDCREARTGGSRYCYYHDKLQKGLLDPSQPVNDPRDPLSVDRREGVAFYPVWPLPADGYVLLGAVPGRLAVA